MSELIAFTIATIVTIPFLGYIILFIICKQLTKNHRRSVFMALDWSTLLLIFSVHSLIMVIWDQSFFWVILLVMLIIAVIFILIHWKTKPEIVFLTIFRGYWRLNFLLFFTAYIVLMVIGLVQSVSGELS